MVTLALPKPVEPHPMPMYVRFRLNNEKGLLPHLNSSSEQYEYHPICPGKGLVFDLSAKDDQLLS
jgi:hypothetical protein